MIFNKIKLNYNIKLLDDLFLHKKYEQIATLLYDQSKNIYFNDLVYYLTNKYLSGNEHNNLFKKKLIWIVSYDLEDTLYINKFVDFYFNKINYKSFAIFDYKKLLLNLLKGSILKDLNEINFELLINNSKFYQNLILMSQSHQNLFATTNSAFFEAPGNKLFAYPQSTACAFFILNNPYKLYQRYKLQNNSHQESLNELLNHDLEKNTSLIENGYKISENRQDWNTHSKSWLDENVQNSFRGKTILTDNLEANTSDALLEILYHFKQSGIDIDINFNLVDLFLEKNPFVNQKIIDISNQEAKQITNFIDNNLLEDHNFIL